MSNGFYEAPRIPINRVAAMAPLSITEQVGAAWEAGRNLDNFNAESFMRDRIWSDRLDEVERVTGTRLPHPDNAIAPEFLGATIMRTFTGATDEDADGAVQRARWLNRKIEELSNSNPQWQEELQSSEQWEEVLRTRAAEIYERSNEVGFLPGLVGGVGAAFTDPINLMTAPLGGGSTLARTVATEAGINVLLEAGNIPVANEWRVKLDLPEITTEEAAMRLATAAAFGASLPILGKVITDGGDGIASLPGIRQTQTARAHLMASAMRQETREAMSRLSRENLIAMVNDLVESPNAEQRAAINTLQREIDDTATNPFEETVHGEGEHLDRMDTALAVAAREEGADLASLDIEPETPLVPTQEPVDIGQGVALIDPRELGVDADRFQFKSGGDNEGVTSRLNGVTQWDPDKAGMVMVWQDLDGRQWIVDGHQRLGLARALIEQDPAQAGQIRLLAMVKHEADNITAQDAFAAASLRNIAEGTGSAIDAARVARARPDLIDGSVPLTSALTRDMRGLSALGDDAFLLAVNEVIPSQYAAIIGRLVDDSEMQIAIFNAIAKLKPGNAFEAEAMTRQALQAGFEREAVSDLFGDSFVTSSLIGERARVLSLASGIMRNDKRIFSTLTDRADQIEAAGNTLSRDTNRAKADANAQLLQILQTLANRAGPVSEALGQAARQVKDGKTAASAARTFVRDISEIMGEGGLSRLLDDGNGSAIPPAKPSATRSAELNSTDDAAKAFDDPVGDGAVSQTARLDADIAEQSLIPGVRPVTDADKIKLEKDKPMRGGDEPAGGLFDDPVVRDQADMFQTPVGVRQNVDGRFELETKTDQEIEVDLASDAALINALKVCKI